ncbi:MAG: hypothetical protein EPO08_15990 [Rhodospirillaceae bacterium]|nr:MAG: hypothetical protein EPO08_15990 [Rhodospirillaceae bacterium]
MSCQGTHIGTGPTVHSGVLGTLSPLRFTTPDHVYCEISVDVYSGKLTLVIERLRELPEIEKELGYRDNTILDAALRGDFEVRFNRARKSQVVEAIDRLNRVSQP